MLDPSRSDLLAGVAGSGTMGRGIVQVLAQCGARVRVYDALAGAAAKAKDAIAKALAGVVAKGRMAQGDAEAALARIEIAESPAAFKDCHLVLEAIALGDAVGAAKVLAILEAMHDFTKDPRYR